MMEGIPSDSVSVMCVRAQMNEAMIRRGVMEKAVVVN